MVRYLHERLLYRVSISAFSRNFLLKGGNFIYAIQGLNTRPTKDVDFSGTAVSNDIEDLKIIFREILSINCEDHVWFNIENISAEIINEHNIYTGVRLSISAGFEKINQKIHADIGFGDVFVPDPVEIEFPSLLEGKDIKHVWAYSVETAIAEKFQTMIFLAGLNSRMKDFFDIYNFLVNKDYRFENLNLAIKATFQNRNTPFINDHILFREEFQEDSTRVIQWKAFLKKINFKEELPFKEVIIKIKQILMPIYNNLK